MNTSESLSVRLDEARRRESECLKAARATGEPAYWQAAYEAREEAQRLQAAIQEALRPNSVRSRDEVSVQPLPESHRRFLAERRYRAVKESAIDGYRPDTDVSVSIPKVTSL